MATAWFGFAASSPDRLVMAGHLGLNYPHVGGHLIAGVMAILISIQERPGVLEHIMRHQGFFLECVTGSSFQAQTLMIQEDC